MILLVDVGNSNICFGFANNDKIVDTFRIKSFLDRSYDEYYLIINNFIKYDINDVIISSVVPVITSTLIKMFKKYFKVEPKVIGNKIKTGINVITDDPKTVGADLIADVAGAMDIFDEGLIIDLGTASKFIYYKNKSFLGVSIAPGVAISMKTLVSSTSLLPNFELVAPKKVINVSTIPCMQSGVIFGYASLVETLICGFAMSTGHFIMGGSGESFSPIPSASAVPRIMQYGTSAPIFTPRCIRSSLESPRSNSRFIPYKTAAASVLPPAMPAATGMCFCSFTSMPSLI